MKDWLKKRSKEATTYLGIALIVEGVGNLAKIDEAHSIAGAVQAAAPSLSAGDWTTGILGLVMGIGGVLMKQKAAK
jgi:hypothetical protein